MGLTYIDGLTIFQLIVFVPSLAVATFLWRRDGFGPGSASWRFISTLSILRITGSICTLIAISSPSSSLETAIIVSKVVGIPPLSISCITMADRVNYHAKLVPKVTFLAIMLTAVAGLVVGIYGADKSLDGDAGFTIDSYIKAAISIYLFLYVSLVGLDVIFLRKWKSYKDPSDKRAVMAMSLATPFIGVKHIYAAISDYGHVKGFGVLYGNTTVYLFMDVLMEMAAVFIILGFGLTFGKLVPLDETNEFEMMENEQRDGKDLNTPSSSGVLVAC